MQKAESPHFLSTRLTRNVVIPFLLLLFLSSALFTIHDLPYIRSPFKHLHPTTSLSSLRPYSPIFEHPSRVHQYSENHTASHDPLDESLAIIRDKHDWRVLGATDRTGDSMYFDHVTDHFYKDEVNVAFFLQVAESSILLAPRLLSRLWHPDNVYAIHFDTKIPKHMTRRFVQALRANPSLKNVLVVPSVPVTYKGISELLNTIDSMHTLLSASDSWDYYINLSGSDYPLVSPVALRRLLAAPALKKSSRTFIEFAVMSVWDTGSHGRLGKVYFDPAMSLQPDVTDEIITPNIKHQGISLPHDDIKGNVAIRIGRGPAWIIGHRSFCDFAARSNAARRVTTLFSTMKGSPEHYFQTLAWNHHKFNESLVFGSMRDVVFSYKGSKPGQHPFYRDGKDENGKWEMWQDLAYSPYFFARKFQFPNSKLLDHIDKHKSGATTGSANVTAVEESLGLVKHRIACLLNFNSDGLVKGMKPCRANGSGLKGCNGNPKELCAGDFAEPPV